jgi:radical SAM protein with 4Fe4S-binding SPASM domain
LQEVIQDTRDIGAKKITWYGGEPFLREDWADIVNYAHQCGLRNDIRTGGQPLYDLSVAQTLVDMQKDEIVHEISIHIDSIDKGDFMKTRNTYPSYYEEVRAGISNLLNLGYPKELMSICIVQTRAILNSFRDTVDWAILELGFPLRNLKLTSFRPCGFGARHPELECTNSELKQNFQHICEYHGWDIEKTPCLHECSKFYCGTMLHIEGNGEVVPCSMMHMVVGNVNQERFKDIYQKEKSTLLLLNLRSPEELLGQCGSCASKVICFGCRANAYNFLNDAHSSDPKCWRNVSSSQI